MGRLIWSIRSMMSGAIFVLVLTTVAVSAQEDMCSPNACGSACGATCVNTASSSNHYDCTFPSCDSGMVGALCQWYDPCGGSISGSSNPCLNGGECTRTCTIFGGVHSHCTCAAGYSGNTCEASSSGGGGGGIGACSTNPCAHGATCLLTISGAALCLCPLGFTGARCTILVFPDDPIAPPAPPATAPPPAPAPTPAPSPSPSPSPLPSPSLPPSPPPWSRVVNECATNNGGCDPLTTCTVPQPRPLFPPRMRGDGRRRSADVQCGPCPPGYTGDGVAGCADINECETEPPASNGNCGPFYRCVNTPGSRDCVCRDGYAHCGHAHSVPCSCDGINECATNDGGCHDAGDSVATCVNTVGSFNCVCSTGYGGTTCAPAAT